MESFREGPNFKMEIICLFFGIGNSNFNSRESKFFFFGILQNFTCFGENRKMEEQSLAGEKWEDSSALNTLSLCLQLKRER